MVNGLGFRASGFGVAADSWLGFGEVEAGDLEAVEEEAGAAGVDFVGGDAAEDFANGGLDVGAIVGIGGGRSKVERRLRRCFGLATGRRVVWW